MATKSYPAEGENGFSIADWASIYGSQDGIIEDYHTGGVSAFTLTRNNTTDACTLNVGSKASVDGYVTEVTAVHELSTPPVASGTKTYTIAVMYDPTLNIADGAGNANPLGPGRVIVTDGALDTSAGRKYLVLYALTRAASQVLTAATLIDYRRWVGPVLSIPNYPAITPATGFGPFSRGTVIIQTDTGGFGDLVNISVRNVNDAGTALIWQNLLSPPAVPLPSSSLLVAQDSPAQMFRVNGASVGLQGTLRRSNGANLGNGASVVVLGTLPLGWRPRSDRGPYVVGTFGNVQGIGRVYISASTGQITLAQGVGQEDIKWLSLDGITFRTGA